MSKLDEWEALAEKATPGPWLVWADGDGQHVVSDVPEDDDAYWIAETWADNHVDAAFIAASRTAVPALIEMLRAIETLCQVADYNDGLISPKYIRTIRDAALGETHV